MLFLLVMEPLHILFKKAQEMGLLKKLSSVCDAFKVLLYADDATPFINPTKQDLTSTNFILHIFAEANGLITNLQKTNYYPIRCNDTELQLLSSKGRNIFSIFPCTYLGLPLHFKKPNHATLQPLV
jgi:hypothetical protein